MLKETLPHMRAARKGQVLVVTSLVGFKGFAFTDAYTASKFALEGMCGLQEAPHQCPCIQKNVTSSLLMLHRAHVSRRPVPCSLPCNSRLRLSAV